MSWPVIEMATGALSWPTIGTVPVASNGLTIGAATAAPSASVSSDPESPLVDTTFTVSAIVEGWPSVTPDASSYSYLWDFGGDIPSVQTGDLYGYWTLDEAAGSDRLCALGPGPDLVESGGTIASVFGRWGASIESTIEDTAAIGADMSLSLSSGLTVSFWFKWPVAPSLNAQSMFTLDNGRGITPSVRVSRFYDSNFLEVAIYVSTVILILPLPRLGPFDVDEWHLFVLTYNPVSGTLTGMVDDGCMTTAESWTALPLPAEKLTATVSATDLATVNAATLSRGELLKAVNTNLKNFEGQVDDLRIYSTVLSDEQIADLWYRSEEESPTYYYGSPGVKRIRATVTNEDDVSAMGSALLRVRG